MPKIAIVNIDWYSHVAPTISVAGELVRRGAEVTYFTSADYRAAVREQGARFAAYDPAFANAPPAEPLPLRITRACLHSVDQIEGRLRAMKPDVIAYDNFCLVGRLLARKSGVKAAMFWSAYAMNDRFNVEQMEAKAKPFRRRRETKLVPSLSPAARASFRRNAKKIEQVLGTHFTERGRDLFGQPDALNICFLPRRFQYLEDTFGASTIFVGPCIAPRADMGVSPSGEDSRPLIFVSMGSILTLPKFYETCLDAFVGSPWRVLLSLGRQAPPELVGRTLGNVELAGFVPQLEVLRRAKLFVTHGGMNSTLESIWFGVPMVVVPQTVEEAATAARVVELGLGRAVAPWVAAGDLRHAVARALDDAVMRKRVAKLRAEAHRSGGAAKAASAILAYAKERSDLSQKRR